MFRVNVLLLCSGGGSGDLFFAVAATGYRRY
jgi:hypothetical protein